MTFTQKRDVALSYLAATGIGRSNYAPPLYRLLWWLGLKLPPPHFNGFVDNAFIMGTYFATFFGAFMTAQAILLTHQITADWQSGTIYFTATALPAGLLFGLFMAAYYAYGAKKHDLPSWHTLQSSTGLE